MAKNDLLFDKPTLVDGGRSQENAVVNTAPKENTVNPPTVEDIKRIAKGETEKAVAEGSSLKTKLATIEYDSDELKIDKIESLTNGKNVQIVSKNKDANGYLEFAVGYVIDKGSTLEISHTQMGYQNEYDGRRIIVTKSSKAVVFCAGDDNVTYDLDSDTLIEIYNL